MVIATDQEEILPIVETVTEGKGVYGGMDAVAGDMTGTLIESVRKGGRILIYGRPFRLMHVQLCRSLVAIIRRPRLIYHFCVPDMLNGSD